MTQWTITKDNLAEPGEPSGTNSNAVGIVGPRGATMTSAEIAAHPKAKQFRMGDEDGVWYEGWLVGDDEFAPLDDFGEPNAGCTRIDILENDEWKQL